ncbi:MAG TPA: hypothetical protein VFK02_14320 [Kofleriaceae bacterium]|nr:hypothetical protein [Kofleriaceae bacterium]
MSKNTSDQSIPSPSPSPRPTRQARLQALLFGGAALGTTALLLGGPFKFPLDAGD